LGAPASYYRDLLEQYRQRRDLLVEGLADLGFKVYTPQGTYFVLADHTAFGQPDDMTFCRYLIDHAGVAAIPPSAFYSNPADGHKLVRFAFCKTQDTLREALGRMQKIKGDRPL
jgi:aspartate/methionine/tyrosine aminotransferase